MRSILKIYLSGLIIALLTCVHPGLSAQVHPDNIYPIPNNFGDIIQPSINLFTGEVNHTVNLLNIAGPSLSYDLSIFYNSRSASLSYHSPNVLGDGYGWKLMDYPKVVEDNGTYYLLDGHAAFPMQLVSDNNYTTGREYSLWKIHRNGSENSWEIIDESGNQYILGNTNSEHGYDLWHLSLMTSLNWQDTLLFEYDQGKIMAISNLLNEQIQVKYEGGLLSGVEYQDNLTGGSQGRIKEQILLSYNDDEEHYKGVVILENIRKLTLLSDGKLVDNTSDIDFVYYETTAATPLSLHKIVSPQGSTIDYMYYNGHLLNGTNLHPVIRYGIDDGFEKGNEENLTLSALFYDLNQWQWDSTETYAQFNVVKVYPGGIHKDSYGSVSDPFGHQANYYFNGMSAQKLKELPPYYDAIDVQDKPLLGQKYRQLSFDKQEEDNSSLVSSEVSFFEIAGNVGADFARLALLEKTLDSVKHQTAYSYIADTPLQKSVLNKRSNPKYTEGNQFHQDSIKTVFTYAFEIYDDLGLDNLHLLTPVIQSSELVKEPGKNKWHVVSSVATTWKNWGTAQKPGWARSDSYVLKKELRESDLASVFNGSPSNTYWLNTASINKRGAYGNIVKEKVPTTKVVTSSQYDSIYGVYPIARFENADITTGEAGYFGFEAYEYMSSWALNGGQIVLDSTYTGNRAYMQENGTFSIAPAKFSPRGNISYLLSANVKLLPGGSCTIGYKAGNWSKSTSVNYNNNGGDWQQMELIHDTPLATQTPTLSCVNALADDLYFMPVDAVFSAMVYEDLSAQHNDLTIMLGNTGSYQANRTIKIANDYNLTGHLYLAAGERIVIDGEVVIDGAEFTADIYDFSTDMDKTVAALTTNNAVMELVYNRLDVPVGVADQNGRLRQLSISYNSRFGNTLFEEKDDFNADQPNQTLQIKAQTDGIWESFSSKHTLNFPSGSLKGMKIENSSLVTSPNSTYGTAAFSQTLTGKDIAVYVEAIPPDDVENSEMGIALGQGNNELRFVLTKDAYTLYNKGTGEVYMTSKFKIMPEFTALVLTLLDGNHLFAYADGRFLFDFEYTKEVRGPITLVSGISGAYFDNFTYIKDPIISKSTFDGEVNPRQLMVQNGPDELNATERLYGSNLDLPMAQTRITALTQTSGLEPQSDLADFDGGDLKLKAGETMSAYGSDRPFSNSKTYDKNPLTRDASKGTGGEFSANQNATQLDYDDNDEDFFNFKEEKLNVSKTIDPDHLETQTFTNQFGDQFAMLQSKDGQLLQQQWDYDRAMQKTRSYTPNIYSEIDHAFNYYNKWGYNYLGQNTLIETIDAGIMWYAYDNADRLRLTMDANGRSGSKPYFIYSKYDGQGRMLELGTYTSTQDEQQQLIDLIIPADTTGGTYNAVNSITVTSGIANSNLVLNSGGVIIFSGEILIKNTALQTNIVSDALDNQLIDSLDHADFPKSGNQRIAWRYDTDTNKKNTSNAIGKLTSTEFKNTGTTAAAIESYKYDEDGNIVTIERQWPDANGFATKFRYTYNLQNQVTRIRNIGANNTGYDITYAYDNMGRLVSIGTPGNPNQFAQYTYGNGTLTETLNDGSFERVYTTNMAGWTESIKDPLFEEKLYYEKREGGEEGYYNGRISSVTNKFTWTSSPANYTWQNTYDPFSRLLSADNDKYSQYSVGTNENIKYDPNGNIQVMEVDNKSHPYTYYPGTNRLKRVDIVGNLDYDPNGNIIASNGYTFEYDTVLVRVSAIKRPNEEDIFYQYAASGQRITKIVGDTLLYYAHGLNDYPLIEWEIAGTDTAIVQYVYGPTGLVAFSNGPLQSTTTTYQATFEDRHYYVERNDFYPSYDQITKVSATLYNQTDEPEASKSIRLNGQQDKLTGLAKNLTVSVGDTVHIEVFAKYPKPDEKAPLNEVVSIAASLTTGFGLTPVGEGAQAYSKLNELFQAGAMMQNEDKESSPAAYLNYMLFDRQFNLIKYGYQRITEAALEDGTCGGSKGCNAEKLSLSVPVHQSGYLYTFVSNESRRQQDVYFDDMTVAHVQTQSWNYVIKDHIGTVRVVADQDNQPIAYFNYLPFGGDMTGLSDDGGTGLRYRYTGQEFEPETGLYNYRARLYHPDLGRFYSADPLGQQFSAYAYAGNDPVLNSDPTGMFSFRNLGFGLLGAGEITAGFVLEGFGVVADATGAAAPIGLMLGVAGSALIGAGVSTEIDVVTSSISGNEIGWGQFAADQAWGAATGVVEFGVGSAVGYLATKIVGKATTNIGRSVAKAAASGAVVGAFSGAASSSTIQVMNNLSQGLKWNQGLGTAAIFGATSGAIGGAGIGYFSGRYGAKLKIKELEDEIENNRMLESLRVRDPEGMKEMLRAEKIFKKDEASSHITFWTSQPLE